MRVFPDACVDPRVTEAFAGHEVATAVDLGWHKLKDYELVPLLQDRFDALVTIDRGFEFEHNLKNLTIASSLFMSPRTGWSSTLTRQPPL
jgi:hypothetical protein